MGEDFSRYIEKVQTRMQTLYREAQQFPSNRLQQLTATLEELSLAVEELRVAEEELLVQNEQTIAAQQIVEAERQRYQDLFNFAPMAIWLSTSTAWCKRPTGLPPRCYTSGLVSRGQTFDHPCLRPGAGDAGHH